MTYTLAIADRANSSWSLRGWLLFEKFDIPVSIAFARLYDAGFSEALADFAPARTVPALRIEGGRAPIIVWDSLAMAETLAERFPDRPFWPGDLVLRGLARGMVAEMHAGFRALREACPMNLRRSYTGFEPSEAVRSDLARIEALWSAARAPPAGPAPGSSAPIPSPTPSSPRSRRASPPTASRSAPRRRPTSPRHLADPAFVAWRNEGLADPIVQTGYDKDLAERPWPGPE